MNPSPWCNQSLVLGKTADPAYDSGQEMDLEMHKRRPSPCFYSQGFRESDSLQYRKWNNTKPAINVQAGWELIPSVLWKTTNQNAPPRTKKDAKGRCMLQGVGGAAVQNGRDSSLRWIREGSLPLNCDYFTKNQPTAPWHQRVIYSVSKLKTVSLAGPRPVSMLREAPGVTSAPLWAVEGPGNLSWCSSCQPWCFAAAVCHPSGWDLLKGIHVNLYVAIQSKAEGWSWQAWQSQQKVPEAEVIAFPQRCSVDQCFFFSFSFIFTCLFSFILTTQAKAYRTCHQSWSSRINLLPSEFFP